MTATHRQLLASLALSACCGAAIVMLTVAAARAQGTARPRTLADVTEQLQLGGSRDRFLAVLRENCVVFPLNRATRDVLVKAGADEAFLVGLGDVCYRGPLLETKSDPANALVLAGDDTLGVTPGQFRVQAGVPLRVEFRAAGARRSANVTPEAGSRTTIVVELPRDTLPIPIVPTATQLLTALKLADRYPDVGPAPAPPEAPQYGSPSTSFTWGGFVVGALAGGAAVAICNQTKTTQSAGYVGSEFVPAGTSYKAGVSVGCVGGVAAAGLVAGGTFMALRTSRANDERRAVYERAVTAHPGQYAAWERRVADRAQAIASDTTILAAIASYEGVAREVRRKNQETRAKNAALAPVTVAVSPLETGTAVASTGAAPAARATEALPVNAAGRGELNANIPRTGLVRRSGYAVVIGNRNYRNPLVHPVEFAANDADAVRDHLIETLGFQPENVIDLRDATLSDLNAVFGTKGNAHGRLFGYLPPDRTADLFVYYVGHGAPDTRGRAYLVPADATPTSLELTGYPLDVLYENIAELPFRSVTVALDACFSGTSDRGSLLRGTSAVLGTELRIRNPLLAAPNALLLSASAPDMVAYWYDEKRHGMFTYFMLSKLREMVATTGDAAVFTGQDLTTAIESGVSRMVRRTRPGNDQKPQGVGSALLQPLTLLPERK